LLATPTISARFPCRNPMNVSHSELEKWQINIVGRAKLKQSRRTSMCSIAIYRTSCT
jgi:hypothetical protein